MFNSGWIGLAYRYSAMVEYDEQYKYSINSKSRNSPLSEFSEITYKQEKAIFGFFVNAVSVVDCYFWSIYFIGTIIKPTEFPWDTETLKHLYPTKVAKKFCEEFSEQTLTKQMNKFVNKTGYTEMKDMRDVLSHRGTITIRLNIGGERDGMETMPTKPKDGIYNWQFDYPIDEKTTTKHRKLISTEFESLTSETMNFCKLML